MLKYQKALSDSKLTVEQLSKGIRENIAWFTDEQASLEEKGTLDAADEDLAASIVKYAEKRPALLANAKKMQDAKLAKKAGASAATPAPTPVVIAAPIEEPVVVETPAIEPIVTLETGGEATPATTTEEEKKEGGGSLIGWLVGGGILVGAGALLVRYFKGNAA